MRRPPRSTLSSSSAASDVYKRQFSKRLVVLSIKNWCPMDVMHGLHGHAFHSDSHFDFSPLMLAYVGSHGRIAINISSYARISDPTLVSARAGRPPSGGNAMRAGDVHNEVSGMWVHLCV
eukprot:TRINITY_DN18294_c0_g1_i3.p2 TRINITY_DN18294_c0_g1~~TRINITY_DN18294_c0_g1_i3.p2  ORF type:complete len:120 (+),score=4.67 TRINITY_DN18294_c0_g1_i3:125-484(+)